jgi:hypothetical protein
MVCDMIQDRKPSDKETEAIDPAVLALSFFAGATNDHAKTVFHSPIHLVPCIARPPIRHGNLSEPQLPPPMHGAIAVPPK